MNWLEVPRGPIFNNEKGLDEVLKKIKEIGKKEKSLFIRISSYKTMQARFVNRAFKISKLDHHPETSLLINLSQSEDEILMQMKQKGRYNIKVAEKHGIIIEESDDIDAFYDILIKTGGRDGFGIHPRSYYLNMIVSLGDNAQLLLAKKDGKIIAGGIFVYLDDMAIYYYGSSDHDYRKMMAPYLMQWTAIKEAKKRGCKYYDFLGISPEDSQKNHPWAGVTSFKKKFGGDVISYPKAKEVILRPLMAFVYRLRQALHF